LPIFSAFFKSLSIKVTKGSRQAKQIGNAGSFVTLSESLEKRKSLDIRVIRIKSDISLGICVKDIVVANKY
jgi:hypothetical protein